MKKLNTVVLILLFILVSTKSNYAQLGGLKNKVKEKVKTQDSKKEEPQNKSSNPTQSESSSPTQNTSPKATNEKVDQEEKTQGITSASHGKHMGKIVFSNEEISFEKEVESNFINSFTLGDAVYFRVYMNNSIVNTLKKAMPDVSRFDIEDNSSLKVSFFLDGKEVYNTAFNGYDLGLESRKTWTTFRGALKKQDNSTNALGVILFKKFIINGGLTSGAHKLKIVLYPSYKYGEFVAEPIASGELSMNVPANFINPDDENMCMPKAKLKNANLETQMIEAFKEKGWKETPKVIRIISKDWIIVKHEYTGVPLKRYMTAAIGSTNEGKCKYQEFDFVQDYNGSSYQKTIYLSGVGKHAEIHCNCLK